MNQRDIFSLAWTIAKEAAFSFDCNPGVFFAEALIIAHKQAKTHCKIEKRQWNFDAVNGHILITTPKGQVIKIINYIARTRNQCKFIFEVAKCKTYLLTRDQIAILINLSNVKI